MKSNTVNLAAEAWYRAFLLAGISQHVVSFNGYHSFCGSSVSKYPQDILTEDWTWLSSLLREFYTIPINLDHYGMPPTEFWKRAGGLSELILPINSSSILLNMSYYYTCEQKRKEKKPSCIWAAFHKPFRFVMYLIDPSTGTHSVLAPFHLIGCLLVVPSSTWVCSATIYLNTAGTKHHLSQTLSLRNWDI